MTTITTPVSFSFRETHDVRIQVIDGEPWFCLKDVCEVLTIANPRRVAAEILDTQGVRKTDTLTNGGQQQIAFINEPNLYRVIFRSNKLEAKQFQDWVFNEVLPTIRKTGRYESKSAPEPLSHKDMINLKRLVWYMASGMKAGESWTQGMWYCLRSVTGRQSPQPYSVEDLPVLADECRRLLKVTTAYNAAIYNFEKDFIRLVLRKRGGIEPLIHQMECEMLALAEQERQGMLMLHKFYEKDISALVHRN